LTAFLSATLLTAAVTCSHDWDGLMSGGTGGAGSTSTSTGGPATCSSDAALQLCSSIPRWPDAGDDAALAQLVPDCLNQITAKLVLKSNYNGGTDAWCDIRAGWAEDGLHFLVDVHDSNVVPAPMSTTKLYNGSSIEIYAKGDTMLSGPFGLQDGGNGGPADGGLAWVDPGALHLVIAAPPPDGELRWGAYYTYYGDKPAGVAITGEGTGYGYRVHVLLPWAALSAVDAGGVPDGGLVALDFALNVVPKGSSTRGLQLIYEIDSKHASKDAAAGAECDNQPVYAPLAPACDDQLWCRATLAP
jgi:hypothetical protein